MPDNHSVSFLLSPRGGELAFALYCCCSRCMDRRPWAGLASDYPNLDEQVGLGLAHGTLSLSINVPCVYQVLC